MQQPNDTENREPSSSCTLQSIELDPEIQQRLLEYRAWMRRNAELTKSGKVRQYLVYLLQILKNIILFIPLIFINMESRFNRTFENVEMYLVLSCTSYADAVDTSIRLNIPMLLLVCNQYDTSEYAKFKKLLEDYEIGHLLNQSFLTAGLHFQERQFKKHVNPYSINKAGLYAFRKNLFGKLEKFAQFLLKDIPTLPDDSIDTANTLERMKTIRRIYYQKRREDQDIINLSRT